MEHRNNQGERKYIFSCILVLCGTLCILGINEAIAKEYFVATSNGKDGNIGTKEAPFLRLEKGVSVLSPGDTLYVRGGTYQRDHYMWNSPNGTSWTNAITIKAYQNEKVIVKPLPSESFPGYTVFNFLDNSQYIIMDGLTVDGTNGRYGYNMGTGSHHIRVSNGEIKNTPNSAIQGSTANYIEVINLKVHDSWTGVDAWDVNNRSYGFYLNGDYNLVQNCEFYNNHGYGVSIFSSTRRPSNNLIINNKFFNNGMAGLGIFAGNGNIAINNIFWNNERGLQVDYGATNTMVYHNTFYSNQKNEILLGPKSDRSFVKNNLLVGASSDSVLFAVDGSGASKIESNLILGASTDTKVLLKISDASATSTGNLLGGLYVAGLRDPDNFDFHLTEASSARGAGQVLALANFDIKLAEASLAMDAGRVPATMTTDRDGVSRTPTKGFDIGAYQYGGFVFEPPTSLRILSQGK